MNKGQQEKNADPSGHHSVVDNDNVPQRPFRQLSGTCSGSAGLFSVREQQDDQEQEEESLADERENNNKTNNKDCPPKKPCSASTATMMSIFDDGSTFPTTSLEGEEESVITTMTTSTTKAIAPSQRQKAKKYEAIRAREQPNLKATTIPIDHEYLQSPSAAIFSGNLQARVQMVKSYWSTLRDRDLEAWRRVLTDDYQMICVGAGGVVTCCMGMDQIYPVAQAVFESLPDFKFMYSEISIHKDNPNCLVLHDFVGSGTHTGKPFALPGFGPPIPPMGTHIVLDECETHYHFDARTNKIRKSEETALGETTGIPGIYKLLAEAAAAGAATAGSAAAEEEEDVPRHDQKAAGDNNNNNNNNGKL